MYDPDALSTQDAYELNDFAKRGFPVYGKCAFDDKTAIKDAGGQWDPTRKLWKAPNLSTLEDLLDTGKFQPNMISAHLHRSIVPHLRAKAAAQDKKSAAATERPKLTAEQERTMKDKLAGVVTKQEHVDRDTKELKEVFGIDFGSREVTTALGPRGGMTQAGQVLQALKTQLHTGCHFFDDSVFDHYWAHLPVTQSPNAPLTDDECWLLRRAKDIPRLEHYARLRIFNARGNSKPSDWDEVVPALWSADGCPRYPSVARQLQQMQERM